MTSQRIGYSRVSTTDQNPDSQRDALESAAVDAIHVDFYTGTKASRPQWDIARGKLRRGDTLVITRLDRLGRSTRDLLEIAKWLEDNGVHLEATEQKIDTATPEGRLFFTMIAAFAEFEHGMMVSRTKDGLAAARARGRVGGRKPKLTERQRADIRKRYEAKASPTELAEDYGVSRQTIYRVIGDAKA
ncbi:recombinase family protein [Pseudoclavibacter terrae]|uniref:Recombinase family protein n=1 Tax=Pseudoclavibacter terrae TaxID=1530195 RepID=A0A7J5B6F4_9MICO|nr:recombinase family protein [Pseudoclavibacter terrae]KAB1639704.1 recombinase family protein [Pseudoclavibacter terrae]